MAPTEMVHAGASLSRAHPSTPPSSPNLPSEQVVTLSNTQQFIEMVNAIVAMQVASPPASKCACSHTTPENPTFQVSTQHLTLETLGQLLLKLTGAKSAESDRESEDSESTTSEDTQPEDVVALGSRLEFKTVDEVYVSNRVQVPVTLTS